MPNGLTEAVHIKSVDPQYGERQKTFISVYPNGRVDCSGADGTSLSLSYAGIRHDRVRETQILLSRVNSAEDALRIVKENGWPSQQYSLF